MTSDSAVDVCGYSPEHGIAGELSNFLSVDIFQDDYECPRSTWEESDRCILHIKEKDKPSEPVREALNDEHRLDDIHLENIHLEEIYISDQYIIGANFKDSQLENINIENCYIYDSDFRNVTFELSSFRNSVIQRADFRGGRLSGTLFTEAVIQESQFNNADLRQANFNRALAEECAFDNSDIRRAEFQGTGLYQSSFRNARVNDETEFGKTYYEIDPERSRFIMHESDPYENPRERTVWTYRMLSQLYRENASTERARSYYIKEKHARRKLNRSNRNISKWIRSELARLVTLYGESPWRVVASSILVIFLSAYIFSQVGGIRQGSTVVESELIPLVYFSIATFTTLGYGDFEPATRLAQVVAGTEAFAGTLLMALLVFVLGRRVTE